MDALDRSRGMNALDTPKPNAGNATTSCCVGGSTSSGSVAGGSPAGQVMLAFLRPLLSDRRVLIIGAIALAVIGIWLGWGWVVALGVAPLILATAPCLIMCALGLCMMGKGSGGQSSNATHGSPPKTD